MQRILPRRQPAVLVRDGAVKMGPAASELGAAVAAKSHRYATTSRPRERAVAFSVAADAGAPSAEERALERAFVHRRAAS